MAKKNHNLFWNQLLMRSDAISDIDAKAEDAREQVLAQLGSLSEQFDRTFDPVDAYEEYVAIALCQAVQRALTPPATAICKVSLSNNTSALQYQAPAQTKPTPKPSEVKPLPTAKATKKSATKSAGSAKKNRGKTG